MGKKAKEPKRMVVVNIQFSMPIWLGYASVIRKISALVGGRLTINEIKIVKKK